MLTDRYQLDAMLGRGGMGEVWRAWDLRLRRPVAVKVLAGSSQTAEDAVARLQHEARTAARLSDPHAVSVYDVGTADGCCFLVMELVPGRSLAQELREEGPLAPARVAAIAAQTAAGLAAAHQRGVVHRDIKPSNLLLDEDGSVKIADFGIARGTYEETTAAATRPGTVLGTSLYLSPEAASGWSAGSPADIYGLGCSLYELLTGRPPFTGEHPIAVLRQHVEDDPVPPRRLRPQTPPEMDAYLLRMLAKQPELRPTAQDAADWFAEGPWQESVPTATEGIPGAAPAAHHHAATAGPDTGAIASPPGAAKRRPAWRKAPAAGALTAAAAIAAAAIALASPLADGNAPSTPSHSTSSKSAGPTAAPGATSAPAAAAAMPHRPRAGAPHTAAPKRHARPGAPASRAATAPAHGHRSTPASAPPTPAPHSTAPRTTPTAGATNPTADPTPTKPTPTPTATTPPAEGDQGA
ncbi:serine/threonine protein kinase [Actinacidiphila yanglinensis]|uniref:non-specific serine/threonine protein kinase n=1 Tax=Actinacidiphila yanglinensis TaxID=310779 RepID=A0A1H6ECX8_9ACTN|nr:serine/threonine-protein kinase [Actinacidiphila yanglinensis]SEG95612.1 serine/threonine protein kinase [Actinacidiphila yanglinensis]